ncbi:MAG: ferrous iron transport protein B [Candidatus Aminicenantes bacterium]|nr:ferrous iron transport protein B [Candidatus Aminicenantes bacterium]
MKKVVLLGQPNCGKSSFFSQISGIKVQTSNFPGTTVKLSRAKVKFYSQEYEFIDLPGTYSLFPTDEAEEATLNFLINEDYDIIVNVIDASLIWRSLELTLELTELEKPMVIILNMMDEAERKGIKINIEKLSEILGVPVVSAIAIHGKGIFEAVRSLKYARIPNKIPFTKHIEEAVSLLGEKVGNRFLAIKYIEEVLPPKKEIVKDIRKIQEEFTRLHGLPAYEVISAERHHLSMKIAEQVTERKFSKKISFDEKLDRFLLHPVFGYFFLVLSFVLIFATAFFIGSLLEDLMVTPLENLSELLVSSISSPFLKEIASSTMDGITGGLGIVLPYFIPLVFLLSLFEEIGYLSRIAFLTDALMHKIGLHGKAIVPFLLGYGCTVPALMSTRILENKRDRVLSALLIPFVPCSARTAVILAMVGYFLGFWYAIAFYFANIIVIAIVGKLLSILKKEPSPELILEVPTYKIPSLKITFKKLLFQIEEFVFYAWPILIAGSIFLGILEATGINYYTNIIFAPLMKALSLPPNLGITLVFGFLRKELTLVMAAGALGVEVTRLHTVLSVKQILVFTTFVTFYIPCLSSVATQWREFGAKVVGMSIVLSMSVAFLLSFLLSVII